MRYVITVVAVLLLAGVSYVGFRLVRHYAFPRHGRLAAPHQICRRRPRGRVGHRPVVAFGDSITWGWGASHNCVPWTESLDPRLHVPGPGDTTYPGDLQRLLGEQVLDYGVPGETAAQGLPRLRRVLALLHPRRIILLEGVNDIMAGSSPGQIAHTLRVMQGLVPPGSRTLELLPTWRTFLRSRVPRVNRLLVHAVPTGCITRQDLASDRLHPNDRGYAVLAGIVARAMRGEPSGC